ncbi:hypothetical protein ACFOQM_14585 [Paenibacillus sp. GCM10012307]|uniref:Uncharacterized protein n=1 Tax=Paenibacillus roseus TaxID=2798579 RepID=A0A934J3A2_9BACL|nr:hypothetical protein [Paenibacillus roseus]MBJ6362489.1 hypothetical protein [Paenibacillus roseus]
MVALIGFERRKHFLRRSIFVTLVLFSVLNIVKIYGVHQGNSLLATPSWSVLYKEQYDTFSGPITNEKIERLMTIYRPLEQLTAELTTRTSYRPPNTHLTNVYEDWIFFASIL